MAAAATAAAAAAKAAATTTAGAVTPSMLYQPVTYAAFVKRLIERTTPVFVDGVWRRPQMGNRKVHALRKQCMLRGIPWPDLPRNELSRPWPSPPYAPQLPFKGHKFEREREARAAKIRENLAKMPKLIEDMRKAKEAERKKKIKGVVLMFREPRPKPKDAAMKGKQQQAPEASKPARRPPPKKDTASK